MVKGLGRFADISHGCQLVEGYCIVVSTLKNFTFVIEFWNVLTIRHDNFVEFCLECGALFALP